jgi:hypothetical protein
MDNPMSKRQFFPLSSAVACWLRHSAAFEPSFRTAIVSKTSARSAAFGRDSRLTSAFLFTCLPDWRSRPTCTNSAAALDVQAGSPEMSFQQSVGVSDVEFSIGDRRRRALRHPGRASRVAPHGVVVEFYGGAATRVGVADRLSLSD